MSAEVKPGYKLTETGVIPEDWSDIKLQDLTIEIGDGIHSTPEYSNKGEYYFINGNNLNDGKVSITNDTKLVDHIEFKKNKSSLYDRSILLSINGTIGNLALYNGEPLVLGKSAAYLNVKTSICKDFLYHALQADGVKRQFEEGLTGTTIRNLGLGTIRSTVVPIPSNYVEQQEIASALSDVDTLISSLDQLIAKKRDIQQAAMQQLLTGERRLPGFSGEWEVKRLESISTFITKGSTPTTYGFGWVTQGVLFLRSECVSENGLDLSQAMFISEAAHSALRRSEIKAGDLLMTITGNVGRIVFLDSSCGCSNINQHIARIRISCEKTDSQFVFHYLSRKEIRECLEKITTGQAYPQLSLKQVRELVVELPPLAEQTAIAKTLSEMATELASLEARREKSRQLKLGMMQELLTGRIRLA